MDRRKFFEQVAAWSAGLCVATPVFNVPAVLAAEEKPKGNPLLTVAKGKEYGALVERALKPLGGIHAFVQKDARVVVKPNIGWDRTPEQAANTHPDVVKAIVRQCLDAGAKQVLVFDRTCQDERRTYANSGIQAAVESIGDERRPVRVSGQEEIRSGQDRRRQVDPRIRVLQGCVGDRLRLLHQRPHRQASLPVQAHAGTEERHGRDRRQSR